jgi:hypothetical protein
MSKNKEHHLFLQNQHHLEIANQTTLSTDYTLSFFQIEWGIGNALYVDSRIVQKITK